MKSFIKWRMEVAKWPTSLIITIKQKEAATRSNNLFQCKIHSVIYQTYSLSQGLNSLNHNLVHQNQQGYR